MVELAASQTLDDFKDLSCWSALASVHAQVGLSLANTPVGGALRLKFEFQSRYGFVVARRELKLELPQSYIFSFLIRGEGGPCGLEFKLADACQNVWRYRQEALAFPEDFQELRIAGTQIEFAWGPQGEGFPRAVAALEIALTPNFPGKGWVEIAGLKLIDETYRGTPKVLVSSAQAGCEASHILTPDEQCWRSDPAQPQWLVLDFGTKRAFGGLTIAWEEGREALAFEVKLSDDGQSWQSVYATCQGGARRSYVYLPNARARYLKLLLLRSSGQGFGICHLDVKPLEFSRSLDGFFASLAKEHPPGWYPKYWQGQQSYWTPTGGLEGGPVALINQEGLVEAGEGAFSIEPFLYFDGRLFSFRDAEISQGLEQGYLPIPWVRWQLKEVTLEIKVFTDPSGAELFLGFLLQSQKPKPVQLFAAIRPFQVIPTWQKWRGFGGLFPIRSLKLATGKVWVNGERWLVPLTPASGFGAAAFAQGPITQYLAEGNLPSVVAVDDPLGLASGALRFDLDLAPATAEEVCVAMPLESRSLRSGHRLLEPQSASKPNCIEVIRAWQNALSTPDFQLPQSAQEAVLCLKTCAAHILVNRQGVALRPGPRRYRRAWIRDGVGMGVALLRLGIKEPLRDFLSWYAGFQAQDGCLPDCVDDQGPEWLPEFDAYGQFLHGLAEYWRLTGDAEWVLGMWPKAKQTIAYLKSLRAQRLTAEYQAPDKRAYFGLLPESMSHEGYMAQPVHAFWDDFWALRGMRDAAWLAKSVGDLAEADCLEALAWQFKQNIQDAVEATCAWHRIEYVPGSVELGDFDPTATAIACALGVEDCLPRPLLERTFDQYLKGLEEKILGRTQQVNYSPYEVRIVQALVRLSRRQEALKLLNYLLADRRLPAWNQWPEIAWRDPNAPCFLGDLPHSWVGAEYILAVLSLFAYEHEERLVLAAGVPWEWLVQGQVAVKGLPTRYGKLAYTLRREGTDAVYLAVEGEVRVPPGGVAVELPGPVAERFIILRQLPQEVRIKLVL